MSIKSSITLNKIHFFFSFTNKLEFCTYEIKKQIEHNGNFVIVCRTTTSTMTEGQTGMKKPFFRIQRVMKRKVDPAYFTLKFGLERIGSTLDML